jgi:hypothetical protein
VAELLINLNWQVRREKALTAAGESPARELGSLHSEAIGAAVEETKPSESGVEVHLGDLASMQAVT